MYLKVGFEAYLGAVYPPSGYAVFTVVKSILRSLAAMLGSTYVFEADVTIPEIPLLTLNVHVITASPVYGNADPPPPPPADVRAYDAVKAYEEDKAGFVLS